MSQVCQCFYGFNSDHGMVIMLRRTRHKKLGKKYLRHCKKTNIYYTYSLNTNACFMPSWYTYCYEVRCVLVWRSPRSPAMHKVGFFIVFKTKLRATARVSPTCALANGCFVSKLQAQNDLIHDYADRYSVFVYIRIKSAPGKENQILASRRVRYP